MVLRATSRWLDSFEVWFNKVDICHREDMKWTIIGGKKHCIVNMGRVKHQDGEKTCAKIHAYLPMPKNEMQNDDIMKAMKLRVNSVILVLTCSENILYEAC